MSGRINMRTVKTILFAGLGLSLGANVWLIRLRAERATSSVLNAPPQVVDKKGERSAGPSFPLSVLELEEPERLRDRLRELGADDGTVRALLEGVLRRRQREKLAAVKIERLRTAWWRAGRSAEAGDSRLMTEMMTEPMRELLGPDPLDLIDAEARYAFLPPEKRRLLGQIDLDYADLQSRVPRTVTNTALQPEADEQRLLMEERRKDVMAALAPDERAEYELRFSGTAGHVVRRMESILATEAEYRGLKTAIDEFDRKSRALPRDENFVKVYEDLQRATAETLVGTLGYERARDFFWSSHSEFAVIARAAQAAELPIGAASRVMELAADTGLRAATVHRDGALSLEEKRAALIALRDSAQQQLDSLLPTTRQVVSPEGLRWLDDLGEGRYRLFMPALISSGGTMVVSITNPPPRSGTASPLLRPKVGSK